MEKKKNMKKRKIGLAVLAILIAVGLVYSHFGGFGTGKSTNVEEMKQYAGTIEDIEIPEHATVIALGEASHGNVEFQELKLEVFRRLVENDGVRSFVLEADYGCCEKANRYIHGGEGSAESAAADLGFAIYRTKQMADLLEYMRDYNSKADEGQDLILYGMDMQRGGYSYQYLLDACKAYGIHNEKAEMLLGNDGWNSAFSNDERIAILTEVKQELTSAGALPKEIQYAEVLIQNLKINAGEDQDYILLRDEFMYENTLWVKECEKIRGNERIFISGHNGHVAKWGSYDAMGKLLADELGDAYYVIGTDFYHSLCNMPSKNGRKNYGFYSYDPFAKATKLAGYEQCYLDFAKLSENTELYRQAQDYTYMGSLGEGYSFLMAVLPQTYRIFQPPMTMYNAMIFVSEATPTEILPTE